jgi:hypothetical protein
MTTTTVCRCGLCCVQKCGPPMWWQTTLHTQQWESTMTVRAKFRCHSVITFADD